MSKIIHADQNFTLSDILAKNNKNISQIVAKIINNVKTKGNEALFKYSKELDNLALNESNIIFTKKEISDSYDKIDKELKAAIELSHHRVREFHEKQYPKDFLHKDDQGLITGWKWYPIDSVGIYVPGGLASYPSSVIMTATIAKTAGVKEIIMTMPCPNGNYNPAVLAAAKIAGVDKIYKIGGSQAIAALAYGSTIIPQTCKIVGPGNAYVAEAKKQVFGDVGIDSIAGPSEILIIADKNAHAKWLAYDLLSQAEHDPQARAILITDCTELAHQTEKEITAILPKLKRSKIATESWENNGQIIIVNSLKEQAVKLANQIAPEHLELIVDDSDYYVKSINNAGAIFIGKYSTEAIGDYMAGPSHVLPTSSCAKFSSGLSIYDFLRKSSIINCDKNAFDNIAKQTIDFANSEELQCHAKAVLVRKTEKC